MCFVLCEFCGKIVDERDLQEGTFICFWCWMAFQKIFPFIKPFKHKSSKENELT